MKQKTVTIRESQIVLIQKLADKNEEGDFSRMLRKIISEWEINDPQSHSISNKHRIT